MKKEIREILKWNKFVFPIDVVIKFKKSDGTILEVPAKKGTVFYEEKDVKKIIRLIATKGRKLKIGIAYAKADKKNKKRGKKKK